MNIRKIMAGSLAAVMTGATLGIGVFGASTFSDFYKNPGDPVFVIGSTAATLDVVGSINIANQLPSTVAAAAAVAVAPELGNLATSARKLYYADAINSAYTTFSSTNLPNALADGKVLDLAGTEYKYTQSLTIGAVASAFGTSSGDLTDPILHVQVGTTAATPLYNYTLSLNKNLNVTDTTNVVSQKIKIQGVDYVIGSSSTNSTLYLFGAGDTLVVSGGETKEAIVGGTKHTIQLLSTSSTTMGTIVVDGVTKDVTEGNNYAYAGDFNVYVKNIVHPAFAGDVRSAELILGAKSLLLQNGQSVKQGSDQTTIKGTTNNIVAAGTGLISGFTVGVAMETSQNDHIAVDPSTTSAASTSSGFTDTVFGGLKFNFKAINPPLVDALRGKIKVDTDNNQFAYATFTSARAGEKGEQKLTFVYDNNTASTAVQPFLARQTIAANKGFIHVLEGESGLVNDAFVVNQGDAGTILIVDDISFDTATSATVTFSDAITGASQKITLTNSTAGQGYIKTGVNFFGGSGYTITLPPNSVSSVNITWSAAGTRTLFPRIKLKDGGWIAFLASTVIPNGTSVIYPDGQTSLATAGTAFSNLSLSHNGMFNGIIWNNTAASGNTQANDTVSAIGGAANCNFNVTRGPALLFIENKRWDATSVGDYICVPLTTTGTTEIAIGTPVFNGTNSGAQTYTSDTYKSAYVDKFGAFVTNEQRTNENGVVTINAPASQMYLDMVFSSAMDDVAAAHTPAGYSATAKLDTEITDADKTAKNLFLVGGPAINTLANDLSGKTCSGVWTLDQWRDATVSKKDKAQISLVNNAFAAGKWALVVAGYEGKDTRAASTYLSNNIDKLAAGDVTQDGTTISVSLATC